MMVKHTCARRGRGEDVDSSLTMGKIYEVYMITFGWPHGGGIPMITIVRDGDDTPIVVSLANFEVVDGRLPPDWFFECDGDVQLLLPGEFRGEFWDDFHNGDEVAELIFRKVQKRIIAFHV